MQPTRRATNRPGAVWMLLIILASCSSSLRENGAGGASGTGDASATGGSGGGAGLGGAGGIMVNLPASCPTYADAMASVGSGGPVCLVFNTVVALTSCGSYESWNETSIYGSLTCFYAPGGALIGYNGSVEAHTASQGFNPDGGTCDGSVMAASCHEADGGGGGADGG